VRGHRVLIIVQNLPVPLDRRVWLECQALRDAGYTVSVICPKGPDDPRYQLLDGVHLFKYRPAPETSGLLSYLVEFGYCWLRTAWLSLIVRLWIGFDVIQACNPPDTYWLLAKFWRVSGVRFVFDHHDLNPELFRSRFGEPRSPFAKAQFAVLLWLERRTYRQADHVVVTNESYRRVALERGRMRPDQVTVVRSGPDTAVMRPRPAQPDLRAGADHLLAYVGIMGPQDGIDVLLRAMHVLVHELGRQDVHVALLGFGDMLEPMKVLAHELDLDGVVTFTGRADGAMLAQYLSTAEIGLSPDLKTPLNDVSTHNKVMEYLAFGLPVVSFDLVENAVSAGDCAVYVPSGDVTAFAKAIDALLDDPGERARLGRLARRRCEDTLDWRTQAPGYVAAFTGLTQAPGTADAADIAAQPTVMHDEAI
jgi:glycosyltransferase involved in cell wall biosynthesis